MKTTRWIGGNTASSEDLELDFVRAVEAIAGWGSMSKDRYYVLILPSVHFVLKVEREALAQGVSVELIPTPRQISTDCGMAVKFHQESLEWLLRLLAQTSMPAARLYRRMEDDFEFLGATGESGDGQ